MANKRMINKTVIDSDAFLDMPQSTQNLYFHLNMRADDDGFLDNPKKIMRTIGSNQNDLEVLLAKRYLISFDSGVIVIKHWRLHNTIRNDRYKPTLYQEEMNQIQKKENGVYTDNIKSLPDKELEDWQPNGNQMTTVGTHRLDKIRLDKTREEEKKKKINKKENSPFQPFNPIKKDVLLNTTIEYWNSKKNLPKCRYQSITLPKISEVITKFDIFTQEEINQSIDNLDNYYLEIDAQYRPSNFSNFFANNSIDSFIDEANPHERYIKPINKDKLTDEEDLATYNYFKKHGREPKTMRELREFMTERDNDE